MRRGERGVEEKEEETSGVALTCMRSLQEHIGVGGLWVGCLARGLSTHLPVGTPGGASHRCRALTGGCGLLGEDLGNRDSCPPHHSTHTATHDAATWGQSAWSQGMR